MKTSSTFLYITFFIIVVLFAACGNQTSNNTSTDSTNKQAAPATDNTCADSFYTAVLSKSEIMKYINDTRRLQFNYYEVRNGCKDSFKIQGWYQDNDPNTNPQQLVLQDSSVTDTSFNTPYYFMNVQLATKDTSFGINLKKLISKYPNDFRIILFPSKQNGYLTIKLRIWDPIKNMYIELTTGSTSVYLNPCPPNKPQ